MIKIERGNVLQARADAIVNTVNCVGFMGKGVALQFKKAYPENFEAYQKACRAEEVQPGRMFIFDRGSMLDVKYIINFPTKRHWKGKSLYEDIETGLAALVHDVRRLKIRSIAIPPLGCGLGGLDWSRVRPMIERAFAALPEVEVQLFEPAGAPAPENMPVRTKRPHLTMARALLIRLMQQYSTMEYRLTLLEIQKLAYFLQEAGQPLRLNYQAELYGPYAPNLNKVLEVLESHYTCG
jgi:O-acetyl-ADP-ribose deacetylase (regulator of RNase III)